MKRSLSPSNLLDVNRPKKSTTWSPEDEQRVNESIEMANLGLSEQQRNVLMQVFKLTISRSNGRPFHIDKEMFITGGAGSGKSFLLRSIVSVAHRLGIQTLVVAHQGVAALNINGSTICSVFKPNQTKYFVSNLDRETYRELKLLIVDEISMVSSEMLDDVISSRLKAWHNSKRNFGKATVVVLGDLMQLAPVGKDAKSVFKSLLWRRQFEMTNLTENHRQHDAVFIENLNLLRWGSVDCIPYFNSRLLVPSEADEWTDVTYLMSTNRSVHEHNVSKFNRLVASKPKPVEIITTTVKEAPPTKAREGWTKYPSRFDALAQLGVEIKVCEGTVILFTSNDLPAMRYCNGDIGVVTKILPPKSAISDRIFVVRINRTDQEVEVEPITVSYDEGGQALSTGMVGNLKGYPITYGWAMTIHKSQGISLDKVVVNPAGIFAPAQLYVALSRARTPEGLRLLHRVEPRHIKVDFHAAAEYVRLAEDGNDDTDVVNVEPIEPGWFDEPFDALPSTKDEKASQEWDGFFE